MVAQLTYGETPVVAYKGMLAEQFSSRQIDSYLSTSPVADVGGGQGVERGNLDGQAKQLAAVGNWLGVSVTEYGDRENASGEIIYPAGSAFPVMIQGRIWVESGAAVAIGEQVVPGINALADEFSPGTSTGFVQAFAKTSAAGANELIMIELVGPTNLQP